MSKKTAIYPGTFDPLTLGHVDLIQRACKVFDEVLVAVAVSDRKKPLFDASTRLRFCIESLVSVPNVRVALLEGLLVDFAKIHGAQYIVRGIRSGEDVAYELANASMNRQLSGESVETVFIPATSNFAHVSATMVREIISLKGDAAAFVPESVVSYVQSMG